MDYTFPEKYYKVLQFFDHEFGDLESTQKIEDKKKLLFYALRQQVEHGPCTSASPSIWWARESYKHAAWKQLGNMSKFEAMVHFVKLLEDLLGGEVNWVEKCKVLEKDTENSKLKGGEMNSSIACDSDMTHNINEKEWDDDIRSHLEPKVENIRYLASEVMKLRSEIRHLYSHANNVDTENNYINIHINRENEGQRIVSSSTNINNSCNNNNTNTSGIEGGVSPPVIRAGREVVSVASQRVIVPPEKPIADNNKSNTNSNINPPLRTSPLFMTTAALRSTRAVSPVPRRRSMGWAEWLGLN